MDLQLFSFWKFRNRRGSRVVEWTEFFDDINNIKAYGSIWSGQHKKFIHVTFSLK